MRTTCLTRRSGVRAPRRSWRLWLVMAAFGAAMFVPATATADPCGEIYVWADGGEGHVYGGAAIALPGGWGCLEWGYTGDVFILAVLYGPSAGDSNWMSGWMYAGVSVGAPANEPGTYYVDGHADVYYGEWGIEYHYDQAEVWVPPPSPPPPTITFSATEPITANYGSGDVIITAQVSPAGYGYESLVYWQGDGVAGDTNLQRKFPTSALGTYSATAVIAEAGGGTEATTPEVRVVPTVSLTPTYSSVPWSYDEYVTITATVQPENAAAVVWSGAGWTPTESNLLRYVATDILGTHTVYANVGEGTDQQEAIVKVEEPVLRIFLDAGTNFNPASPQSDDLLPNGRGWVPGADLQTGASVALPQQVELIAAFMTASGQIVAPPPGVTGVTISLDPQRTSAFVGYAMNSPLNTTVDFQIGTTVAGAGNTWRAALDVYDYGGFTTVVATPVGGSRPPAELRLPRDDNNNLLPDVGWYADGEYVPEPTSATEDSDAQPAVSPLASRPWGEIGDGLSAYEEYRGFIVEGVHRRTDPRRKDLFVTFDLEWRVGFASNLRREDDVGLRVLEIRGSSSDHPQPLWEHDESGLIAFRSHNESPTGDVPAAGAIPQRAVRLFVDRMSWNPSFPGDFGGVTTSVPAGELVPPGIAVPSDVEVVTIRVLHGLNLAGEDTWMLYGVSRQYTEAEARNEVNRSFGHEVGHTIAICHLDACPPGDPDGPERPISVMGSTPREGPSADHPFSRYSEIDRSMIRFHRRP
jgi:hypothetical protein